MKIGMNLLLWTTHVTAEHFPLLAKLKATGPDDSDLPRMRDALSSGRCEFHAGRPQGALREMFACLVSGAARG